MNNTERIHLHTQTIETRWGDMDALGHVNNMIYFQYFEQARGCWLARIGEADCLRPEASISPVLLNAQARFIKPIVYPATLDVLVLAPPVGNSSLNTCYEIRNHHNHDELFATGEGLMVWVDKNTGSSTRIPDFIRNKIKPFS